MPKRGGVGLAQVRRVPQRVRPGRPGYGATACRDLIAAPVLAFAQLPGDLSPFAIPLHDPGAPHHDLTLATLRMLVVARGRRRFAWVTGFVPGPPLRHGHRRRPVQPGKCPGTCVAYAAGFATGNVVGIAIEDRLAPGHSLLADRQPAAAPMPSPRALRQRGWAPPRSPAMAQEGTVGVVLCFVPRREMEDARRLILQADPEAFVTVEDVRSLYGGWRA